MNEKTLPIVIMTTLQIYTHCWLVHVHISWQIAASGTVLSSFHNFNTMIPYQHVMLARYMLWLCLSICLWQASIISKWLNGSSWF